MRIIASNPIRKVKGGYKWGSVGPQPTKERLLSQIRAVYASGWREKNPKLSSDIDKLSVLNSLQKTKRSLERKGVGFSDFLPRIQIGNVKTGDILYNPRSSRIGIVSEIIPRGVVVDCSSPFGNRIEKKLLTVDDFDWTVSKVVLEEVNKKVSEVLGKPEKNPNDTIENERILKEIHFYEKEILIAQREFQRLNRQKVDASLPWREIKSYRLRINKLKKQLKNRNPELESYRICPHCGAKIYTPGSTVLLWCPVCDKRVDDPSDWRKGWPEGGKRNPTEAEKILKMLRIKHNPKASKSLSVYEDFHKSQPIRMRKVKFNIPTEPLVKIGRLVRLEYEPEGSSRYKNVHFTHDAGDLGSRKIHSNSILATNAEGTDLYIIKEDSKSPYPKFSERGILG